MQEGLEESPVMWRGRPSADSPNPALPGPTKDP